MTVQVGILNLETHGGARREGGATWFRQELSDSAITFRDLVLYTTNEKWQVVNLIEVGFLQQQRVHLCFQEIGMAVPDMFTDARFNSSSSQDNKRGDDGAKRMFFAGEIFVFM